MRLSTPMATKTSAVKSMRHNSISNSSSFINHFTNSTKEKDKSLNKSDTSQLSQSLEKPQVVSRFIDILTQMKFIVDKASEYPSLLFEKIELKDDRMNDLDKSLNRSLLGFELEQLKNSTNELYNNVKENNISEFTPIDEEGFISEATKMNKDIIKSSSERRILIYERFFSVCKDSISEIIEVAKDYDNIQPAHLLQSKNGSNMSINVNLNLNTVNNISRPNAGKTQYSERSMVSKKRTKKKISVVKDENIDDCDISDDMTHEGSKFAIPSSQIRHVNIPKDPNHGAKVYTDGDAQVVSDDELDDVMDSDYDFEENKRDNKVSEEKISEYKRMRKIRSKSALINPRFIPPQLEKLKSLKLKEMAFDESLSKVIIVIICSFNRM